MESALPRWQEGCPLALGQLEGRRRIGVAAAVMVFTRQKRRPEGYPPRWIAAVLPTVKERRGEGWERKKLIRPWPRVQAARSVWSAARAEGRHVAVDQTGVGAARCPTPSCQHRKVKYIYIASVCGGGNRKTAIIQKKNARVDLTAGWSCRMTIEFLSCRAAPL